MAEEQNENLDNPGEYDSKSDYSKAEVVRQQVAKVNDCRSKEMKEGYFNTDKLGNKIYIPDSRKEFISSVIALRTLLQPEILRDSIFKEKENIIFERIKAAVDIYGIYEADVLGNNIIEKKDKPKFIPNIGEIFPVRIAITNKAGHITHIKIEYQPGLFDRSYHAYWNFMVGMYDDLNTELSSLIDRCKYFKEGISF